MRRNTTGRIPRSLPGGKGLEPPKKLQINSGFVAQISGSLQKTSSPEMGDNGTQNLGVVSHNGKQD